MGQESTYAPQQNNEFRRMATVKSVTNRSIGLRSGVRGLPL